MCCLFVDDSHERQYLFQEIFLNVWRNLDSFRNESNIQKYIYRICINTAIKYNGSTLLPDIKNEPDEQFVLSDNDALPIPELTKDKELEKFLTAIHKLPILDKSIVALALEGTNVTDIAKICGIGDTDIKKRLEGIKKKIEDIQEEM